jgi:catechol 2,3-dioxygenase-like lactoylglutathione lyase family enzyme
MGTEWEPILTTEGDADVLHLARVTKSSPNVDRLAAWYEGVLGLRRLFSTSSKGSVLLALPPCFELHLVEGAAGRLIEPPYEVDKRVTFDQAALQRGHRIAFRIVSLDHAEDVLCKWKVDFSVHWKSNFRRVFCFDPDGNGVELEDCGGQLPNVPSASGTPVSLFDFRGARPGFAARFAGDTVGVLNFIHRAVESMNADTCTRFYKDLLGLREHARPASERIDGRSLFAPPGALIHVEETDAQSAASPLPEGPRSCGRTVPAELDPSELRNGHHLAFAAPPGGTARCRALLASLGVRVHEEAGGGLYFFDVDGNGLCVTDAPLWTGLQ